MKKTIEDMLAYNSWANERLCSLIREELADAEVKSSFPSIRKTLYHLWDAQHVWEKRLQGESPAGGLSKDFKGSLDEFKKLFIEQSQRLASIGKSMSPDANIAYRNVAGQPFENSVGEILLHLSNHSTFHRGQIVSMLRILGETKLASTDLITWYREKASANN